MGKHRPLRPASCQYARRGDQPPRPPWDLSLWGHRQRYDRRARGWQKRLVPWPEGGKSWGHGGEAPDGASHSEISDFRI